MLAFFGNLSLLETAIALVVAILVFGGRLPQVAARVYQMLMRLRRSLADLRQEVGIDRELAEARRELARAGSLEPRHPRRSPFTVEPSAEADPASAPKPAPVQAGDAPKESADPGDAEGEGAGEPERA